MAAEERLTGVEREVTVRQEDPGSSHLGFR